MKILILEYITGGGLRRESLPGGLTAEAELMVRALLRDLTDADASMELMLLRDDRLPEPPMTSKMRIVDIGVDDDFQSRWQSYAAQCDAVWPIAPETDGILSGLCRAIEAGESRLLNSSSHAVGIAGSKLATIELLERHGIPAVPTLRLHDADLSARQPIIIKPDDGVGCEGMRIFTDKQPDPMLFPENFIVQPWITGESLSLSGVFGHGKAKLLSVNRQIIEIERQSPLLRACEINVYPDEHGEWQDLLDRIAKAIPGLWGYAGVDLIMTPSGPLILEINPRLTSSYAGIRNATGINPSEQVLKLLHTDKIGDFVCLTRRICRVILDNANEMRYER